MIMNKKIKALSAIAAFVATAFVAHAQGIPTAVTNDIIVGFRAGGASANNIEVNTGLISTLAGYSTQTTIGNFNSLLNGITSSSWTTTTSGTNSLNWGAAGTAGATNVFASSTWDFTTAGTLGVSNSSSWTISNIGTPNTNIGTLYTAFNGGNATPNGDSKSVTIGSSVTGSWSKTGGTGASAFGAFNPNNGGFSTVAANVDTGTVFSAADLYSVVSGSSTLLGTFALYTASDGLGHSAGDLTFTSFTAIPEPSTYAMILGVAVLGFVMIRRRTQSLVEA
jgi:hypothetical protein